MQRSRRLERQRLLQREYGKQSMQQTRMVGGRTLWNLGRTAANLPSLAAVSPCPHLCLAQSLSLTCPLLGLLLPLSCCCLGRSLLSHHEQNIGSWRRLSGQGHVHAHVHCGLHNRHYTLRENGGSTVRLLWNEFAAFPATSALRSPVVKTKDPSYHKAFLISRQESEETPPPPHKRCIGVY